MSTGALIGILFFGLVIAIVGAATLIEKGNK